MFAQLAGLKFFSLIDTSIFFHEMTHFHNLKLRRAFFVCIEKSVPWYCTFTVCEAIEFKPLIVLPDSKSYSKEIQIIVHVFIRGNVAELQITFDC